jgi:hypothetical protein
VLAVMKRGIVTGKLQRRRQRQGTVVEIELPAGESVIPLLRGKHACGDEIYDARSIHSVRSA